jgi:hypothetical protein
MHSVPEDYGLAERQPWLGTIPIYELVNRVPVAALSIGTGKAVEESGFRDFEVWQPQHLFRGAPFALRFGFCFISRGLHRHGMIMYLLAPSWLRFARDQPGTTGLDHATLRD